MGKKRPHSESEPFGHLEDGRSRPAPQKHWSKRQKVDLSEAGLGAIKKRARALERLLAKQDLKIPADKQNDLERELAAHKQRIAEAMAKKHRSRMIGKYHMVRFFERKKAMRFVKQMKRQLSELEDPEEIAKTKADLHIAEVDLDYAIYYPFLEPYASLYKSPSGEKKGDEPTTLQYLHAPRPPIWSVVEKVREEGKAALEKLQNRQPETGSEEGESVAPKASDKSKTQPKKKQERQRGETKSKSESDWSQHQRKSREKSRPAPSDGKSGDDSDSDGGFFE
ncbi:hypothetical protein B0T14DRAFT_425465 [Immersiella caudata]|uniref:rRNA-processing protein EFG1 n=1 Tax=Immersiella caudata TaxID=314043 RepID=A0AA39T0D2_9PEZI|nr:hypothetical protein B0T14DRAFT_441995 [Immersiella caudata]KAK0623528.1 hypothetical protein B0T14DRAFT_425465 [Immersiella caudata]